MRILVERAGLQTTVQAGPRTGLRHKGVPSGGGADALSLALANRLVGNPPDAPGLEITLSGARLRFLNGGVISLTGGQCNMTLAGRSVLEHETLVPKTGDILDIGSLTKGTRIYVAAAGGISGSDWLGAVSTYLPAGLGGHHGRALKDGDELITNPSTFSKTLQTPAGLRPHIGRSWALRTAPGPEFDMLDQAGQRALFAMPWSASQRLDRMGAALEGPVLQLNSDGRLPSAAVFPGTLQCPPSGQPFLLMAEAQTTGGYPRIGQIIRADRHMLGQLRPGDRLTLIRTEPEEAARILRSKTALFRDWLGDAFELR